MPPEEGGGEKVGEDIPSPEYGGSEKTPLHSSVTWDETTRLPESTTSKGGSSLLKATFSLCSYKGYRPSYWVEVLGISL